MDYKAYIRMLLFNRLAKILSSRYLHQSSRQWYKWRRQAYGAQTPTIRLEVVPTDPHAQLLYSALVEIQDRYAVKVVTYAVPEEDWPHLPAERQAQWARQDAALWQKHYQIDVTKHPLQVDHHLPNFRNRLGVHSRAMAHFDGECYNTIARLHYLEQRLRDEGLAKDDRPIRFPFPSLKLKAPTSAPTQRPTLTFYASFRSPYTYLAISQIEALQRCYPVDVKLKVIMPMAMRGMRVTLQMRGYFLQDCMRESLRLGVPFGDIADPIGEPVKHLLALDHYTQSKGLELKWCAQACLATFGQGIWFGQYNSLVEVAARIGLTPQEVQEALQSDDWQARERVNRAELLDSGLWGVPSFRVNDLPPVWGQDRLWVIEQQLLDEFYPPSQSPQKETS